MPALDGMRVLDMTQWEAGTSCTQLLAWLGADVVKVERPTVGDPGRVAGTGDDPSPYFLQYNSNKRSIAIDLDTPSGRDLLLELVPHYDVFVENYGPGVIEKHDIGYAVMQAINPGIIYGRIKGFGTSGPYSDYKCFDMVAQAAGGAFSVTGSPDGPPMRRGVTVGDSGTGVQMALAITAAYVQQQRTGLGQEIELSMQEAVTHFMRSRVAFDTSPEQPVARRVGNRSGGAPTDLYSCKPFGPNDYVFIMVVTSRMWDAFCVTIDRTDLLTDPRFATGEARRENPDALNEEIELWTRAHTKYETMQILADAGVPCSYVFDTGDLVEDPHLRSRDFVQTVNHPTRGEVQLYRYAPRLSGSNVPLEAAPSLGEHTEQILVSDLGLDAEALRTLSEAGAIGLGAIGLGGKGR